MSIAKRITHFSLIVLTVLWHIPLQPLAAQTGSNIEAISTAPLAPVAIKLAKDGVLHGTAVFANGNPANGETVILGRAGKPIAKTKSDNQGRFKFTLVRPGDYQIATRDSAAFLQCFAFDKAPQESVPQILLSKKAMIARGQQPLSVLCHPLLIGLVIAAAIAIPIAVAANNDDAS